MSFKALLLLLFLIYASTGYSQIDSVSVALGDANISLDCRSGWTMSALNDLITGTIIAHSSTMVGCGGIITGSLSYIKLTESDTIRVIEYCGEKEFSPGQIVQITSDNWLLKAKGNKFDRTINTSVFTFLNSDGSSFLPDCSTYKSYYGSLSLRK